MAINWSEVRPGTWHGLSGRRLFIIRRTEGVPKATHSTTHHSLYEADHDSERYIMSAMDISLCHGRAEEELAR